LSVESAIVEVPRRTRVAGGVYAPGHVGELTQVVPFELVDAVLAETGVRQRRLRDLPSRVGVYLVLAMGLFEGLGMLTVWSKLVAGLDGMEVVSPSEKALRDLRRRLGPAPLRALFEVLAGPLAWPGTPGVRYRCWRTVAFDGCSSMKVPDHERNRGWLGKIKHGFGLAGYPRLTVMALAETGTRGLLGAVFGPTGTGERAWARKLLYLLGPDMLLLCDRGFEGEDFLAEVAETGAQFLVRVKSSRRLPVRGRLPDGSYLTRIGSLSLRVIDAQITVTGADSTVVTGVYRLVTTLTDHRTDPAAALMRLYHERWEIESAFYALRHTLLGGRVLRSKDPAGIEQELWALLTLYQALRTVMVDAAESEPGTDPDRAGFTVAVEAARDSVITATGIVPETPVLVGDIGTAVLARLLPARRHRYSARTVKSPLSRYHTRTETQRPLTCTTVTSVEVTISEPPAAPPPAPTAARTPGYPDIEAILGSAPHSRRARDIAHTLGITGEKALNSFCVRMSKWAHQGLLTKTAPATYTLATENT